MTRKTANPDMSDPRIRKIFKEAADIAKSMPPGLQEAAFNRALDVLLGELHDTTAARGGEDEAPEERERLLGIPGAGLFLEKSVAAFNVAAGTLGIGELDADEVADVLEEKLGPHIRQSVIGRAFESADSVVETACNGADAVFRMFGGEAGEDDEAGTAGTASPRAPNSSGKKSAPRTKASGGKKKATARKKPPVKPTASRSVAGIVFDLAKKGFFTSARTASQVAFYLNRKGLEITVREVTPILMRLIQAGLLSRTRSASGEYVYERA